MSARNLVQKLGGPPLLPRCGSKPRIPPEQRPQCLSICRLDGVVDVETGVPMRGASTDGSGGAPDGVGAHVPPPPAPPTPPATQPAPPAMHNVTSVPSGAAGTQAAGGTPSKSSERWVA